MLGYDQLVKSDADVKYIIVLTDGMWGCSTDAIEKAKRCHAAGIEVMALGFGAANQEFLQKIASTNEFVSMTDLANLGGSFSKIAQSIGEGTTGLTML